MNGVSAFGRAGSPPPARRSASEGAERFGFSRAAPGRSWKLTGIGDSSFGGCMAAASTSIRLPSVAGVRAGTTISRITISHVRAERDEDRALDRERRPWGAPRGPPARPIVLCAIQGRPPAGSGAGASAGASEPPPRDRSDDRRRLLGRQGTRPARQGDPSMLRANGPSSGVSPRDPRRGSLLRLVLAREPAPTGSPSRPACCARSRKDLSLRDRTRNSPRAAPPPARFNTPPPPGILDCRLCTDFAVPAGRSRPGPSPAPTALRKTLPACRLSSAAHACRPLGAMDAGFDINRLV